MNLGELIDAVRSCGHSRVLRVPHSYRGSYEHLAFELVPDVAVLDMLESACSAEGRVFDGWKGGEFTMTRASEVYVANHGDCGAPLTPELLSVSVGFLIRGST